MTIERLATFSVGDLKAVGVECWFTPGLSLSEEGDAGAVRQAGVSPGFTPRPSLSGGEREGPGVRRCDPVSPGFTPRFTPPAFVERARTG